MRIVEYLKKIEWDQQNVQNKMNPYHFMTAHCFWFVVCSEYFSYNFFSKRNPVDAINEITSKINRINYPIPLRISKNMIEIPPHPHPTVESNSLLQLSERITETLKEVIPSVYYEYYY
jgi:hypothetical protein